MRRANRKPPRLKLTLVYNYTEMSKEQLQEFLYWCFEQNIMVSTLKVSKRGWVEFVTNREFSRITLSIKARFPGVKILRGSFTTAGIKEIIDDYIDNYKEA